MFLNIITPCTRLQNLNKIAASINIPKNSYRWIVVFDSHAIPQSIPEICEPYAIKIKGSVFGNGQRNYALNLVKQGHVYFNDDDTLLHSKLWEVISPLTQDFISFQQVYRDGKLRLKGDVISPNMIDSHNFIASIECIGKVRWELSRYDADGPFASNVYRQATTKVHLPITLSVYNALRS